MGEAVRWLVTLAADGAAVDVVVAAAMQLCALETACSGLAGDSHTLSPIVSFLSNLSCPFLITDTSFLQCGAWSGRNCGRK